MAGTTNPAWLFWSPGEPDGHLLGFVSKAERDAHGRGEPGPFRRIIRTQPASIEARLIRAYCNGQADDLLKLLRAI